MIPVSINNIHICGEIRQIAWIALWSRALADLDTA